MSCCNVNRHCEKGLPCPSMATRLKSTDGGQQVDTLADAPEETREPQPWDMLDKIIWRLFIFGVGAFSLMTVIQISRWINR